MTDNIYVLTVILITAIVTAIIRSAPFIIFRRQPPAAILYLGDVLPYAIMGMLIIYCLKDISFIEGSFGIPEIISAASVAALHKWKHNMLLSILVGTAIYMILIQFVF